MAIIEAHGLSKRFKTRQGVVEAVQGVDMHVEAGQIFGFLGPNGAGKTTTLRMLSTLLEPSGGQASVAGYDLLKEPGRVRERIGYVSQAGGAEDSATVQENVIFQARLYGRSRAQAQERCRTLFAALELEAIAGRITRTLSGGQRRRLDLAMGMVHQPLLLFLDEPTVGLDPQSRARLWDEVRRLCAEGTTIFLTTHYLDEADALCDQLAIIDHGTIVAEGTPAALKRQIAGDVVTLGIDAHNGDLHRAQDLLRSQPFVRDVQDSSDGLRLAVEQGEEALPRILDLLSADALKIRTIALARPTLDDVFLRQTGRSLRESVN